MKKIINNVNCDIVLWDNENLYSEIISELNVSNTSVNISTYATDINKIYDFLYENKKDISKCNLYIWSPFINTYNYRWKREFKKSINKNKTIKFIKSINNINNLWFVDIHFSLKNHAKIINIWKKLFLGSQNILTKEDDYNIENWVIIKDVKTINNVMENFSDLFVDNDSYIYLSNNLKNIDCIKEIIFHLQNINLLLNDIFRYIDIDFNEIYSIDSDWIEDFSNRLGLLKTKIESLQDIEFDNINKEIDKDYSLSETIKSIYSIFYIKSNNNNSRILTNIYNLIWELEESIWNIDYVNYIINNIWLSFDKISSDLYSENAWSYDNMDDMDNFIDWKSEVEFEERLSNLNNESYEYINDLIELRKNIQTSLLDFERYNNELFWIV